MKFLCPFLFTLNSPLLSFPDSLTFWILFFSSSLLLLFYSIYSLLYFVKFNEPQVTTICYFSILSYSLHSLPCFSVLISNIFKSLSNTSLLYLLIFSIFNFFQAFFYAPTRQGERLLSGWLRFS